MTNTEFITQFDIFYNNIASNAAPSIDSYEKSVFLTEAQKDIVLGIYNGRSFPGMSFESTEESRRYLSNLIKRFEVDIEDINELIDLPDKLWFITLEEGIYNDDSKSCLKGSTMSVVPVKHDDLQETLKNPFKGPSSSRILRVDLEGKVKLYSKYKIDKYIITYLEKPNPIILEDLSDYNLTIEGISTESESNVNPILHKAILERAVALAKAAYIGSNQ